MATPLGSQPRIARWAIWTLSRFIRALGPLYRVPLISAARCWRLVLWRTTFVAITGSVGKTTAKEALARGLAAAGPTLKSPGTANVLAALSKTILRVRPWHRYAVLEVGTDGPGAIGPATRLVRPHVAVVTCVESQHLLGFRNLEEIAVEKATLLEGLQFGGIAVLNRDDPAVAAMEPPAGRSTIWFGRGETCDCRVISSDARWPERLTVRLQYAGEKMTVETELLGTHWERSIAAAVSAGIACGLAPSEISAGMSGLEPTLGRMQPIDLGNGITLIRDEVNGSFVTLEKALKFLREARCKRRVFIGSDITDLNNKPASVPSVPFASTRSRKRARLLGEMVAGSSDCAVFLGRHRARAATKGAISAGMPAESIRTASHWTTGIEVVRELLQPGDLVLIKGPAMQHLTRLALSLIGTVECREDNCGRTGECDYCPKLGFRAEPPLARRP